MGARRPVIHYHGGPVSPRSRLLELAGRCFCVSFANPRDVDVCHEIGQSVMLDNGAFTIWRASQGNVDVDAYAGWVRPWLDHKTTWCVIPDIIDGTEEDNDALLRRWSQMHVPQEQCAPVWHMHEPIDRLKRLCEDYFRVCIGSSGQYAKLGNDRWHRRMSEAMNELCGNGASPCWLHMLRGLGFSGSDYPFASADSTNIAQNCNGSNAATRTARPEGGWHRPRDPRKMADEIDGRQCAPRWRVVALQEELAA